MHTNPEFLFPVEAARYLGFAASTLAKMRHRGDGPIYCKVGGKRVYYRKADLDAWLARDIRTSTSQSRITNSMSASV